MNIQHFFHQTFKTISHIFAPPFCVQCKKFLQSNIIFCVTCENQIKPVVSSQLQIGTTKTVTVFAMSAYNDPIRSLILAKSWRNRLAAKQLGQLIWKKTYIKNTPFDLIVPVPLHWSRYAWRGYNQAEVIAEQLSALSGKPIINAVMRTKRTPFLSSVSAKQRAAMIKDVFQLTHQSQLIGKKILLVDDLLTTGATLRSVVKQLYKAKPAAITSVVAARVC